MKLCKQLMKLGYKPHEIDQMDIHFLFNLLESDEEEQKGYIDQVIF